MECLKALLLTILAFFKYSSGAKALNLNVLPSSSNVSTRAAAFGMAAHSFTISSMFTGADANCVNGFSSPRFNCCRADFLARLGYARGFSLPRICGIARQSDRKGPVGTANAVATSSMISIRLTICCSD